MWDMLDMLNSTHRMVDILKFWLLAKTLFEYYQEVSKFLELFSTEEKARKSGIFLSLFYKATKQTIIFFHILEEKKVKKKVAKFFSNFQKKKNTINFNSINRKKLLFLVVKDSLGF